MKIPSCRYYILSYRKREVRSLYVYLNEEWQGSDEAEEIVKIYMKYLLYRKTHVLLREFEQNILTVLRKQEILPNEFLQSIMALELSPGVLSLKIGYPIILLQNLSSKDGLCNGTRGVIEQISHCVFEIYIIGRSHNNELAFIPQITLTPLNIQDEFTFILH